MQQQFHHQEKANFNLSIKKQDRSRKICQPTKRKYKKKMEIQKPISSETSLEA
jgi:hypothetical protein